MTRNALTAIPWLQRSVDVGAERRVQVAAGADGAAGGREHGGEPAHRGAPAVGDLEVHAGLDHHDVCAARAVGLPARVDVVALLRSEEHTSELQSRLHLVCRLLL